MYSDSESRSRYLSLAFRSRRTIDGLRSVVADAEVEQRLSASLDKLLAANDQESDNFVHHLGRNEDWTQFEDLSLVDEVKGDTGTDDLQIIVESVLRGKDLEDAPQEYQAPYFLSQRSGEPRATVLHGC